jgi:hypothetical protein
MYNKQGYTLQTTQGRSQLYSNDPEAIDVHEVRWFLGAVVLCFRNTGKQLQQKDSCQQYRKATLYGIKKPRTGYLCMIFRVQCASDI